ncbi:ubiquitin-protein transferase [Aureococcus anophagefferens]|nr:ubiquitin-protein transferase [Aureococcus anophagefferens]
MARSPERPRRRAYAPLLAASLDASARNRVDDLWQDMVRDDVALSEADYANLFRSRLAGPPAGVDEVLERLGRDAGVFAVASRTAAAMARDANAAPAGRGVQPASAPAGRRARRAKRLALDGADRAQLRAAVLRAGRRGGAQRERLEAFAEAFDRRSAAAARKPARRPRRARRRERRLRRRLVLDARVAVRRERGCDFAVSNDAARDHHFMHLAPLPFQRWKRRHVLRFAFRRDAAGAPAAFALDEPPTFSAELQRLETASHVAWRAPRRRAGRRLALARLKIKRGGRAW